MLLSSSNFSLKIIQVKYLRVCTKESLAVQVVKSTQETDQIQLGESPDKWKDREKERKTAKDGKERIS